MNCTATGKSHAEELHAWLGINLLAISLSLEEGMATHSSVLARRIPWSEKAWWATVHVVTESWTGLKRLHTHTYH